MTGNKRTTGLVPLTPEELAERKELREKTKEMIAQDKDVDEIWDYILKKEIELLLKYTTNQQ